MTDQRWMTVQGVVSELFGYWGESPTEATVRRWCAEKVIPGAIVTHTGWKVPREPFLKFMREGLRRPASLRIVRDDPHGER